MKKPSPHLEKLDSSLVQLVTAWTETRHQEFAERRALDLPTESTVRVVVEAVAFQESAAQQQVMKLGGTIELQNRGLIQAIMPISGLALLSQQASVLSVRPPYPAITYQGDVISEGFELINADHWHAQGWHGDGRKVGVIDLGFAGYAGLLGTELPGAVTTLWTDDEGTSVHGTACAEIIYDIAPAADLYLARMDTEVGLGNAIDWMIGHGVDVISFSMGYLNTAGPGDGTGWINDRVRDAYDAGILFVTSAGNQAQTHWSGPWMDTYDLGFLEFAPEVYMNDIIYYAHVGDVITVGLRWDDPWGASDNDYDLLLFFFDGDGWTLVALSDNYQTGTQNPTESIQYIVPGGGGGWYSIVVAMSQADGTSEFDLMTFHHNLQYQVPAGSITIPADSPHALTVGAVSWDTPNTLADYSSQGPTTDGRTKPDLVAPAGVSTASYGPAAYHGTSASAPHVAGAAILVKQSAPTWSPTQIQHFLETNAVHLGSPGKSNQFGSGRLDLPPVSSNEVVHFPDPGLEAAIRDAIVKPDGDILQSDLVGLTYLDAEDRGISDLTGIEHCVDLTLLILYINQIIDLTPLASLTHLTDLDLGDNQISDLAPLEGLINLEYLWLDGNQISNLAPLEGLINLAQLWLAGNQITDLTSLAGLSNLRALSLSWNQISDLTPLAGLTALSHLYLSRNQISDITPLVNNAGLGSSDYVDLRYNYLCFGPGEEDEADLQALLGRGVNVQYDPQTECRPDLGKDTPAIFRVDASGNVLADGTVFSPTLGSGSADVAEWVLVSEEVEPGDVLEHDPANPLTYRKSSGRCSSLVAGVVSTQPGLVLGTDILQISPETTDGGHAMLALVGIVPVKVTNEGGPIQPGDLLVASSTPGHAMRWDQSMEGCISLLGKALEPMSEENGVILILLTAP